MARRLLIHIGLPKTGTTYLQASIWAHKGRLRRQGILLPLRSTFSHYVAALELSDTLPPHLASFKGTLDRLIDRINEWDQDIVVSHELFTTATAEQIAGFKSRVRAEEVHLIVTARDVVRQVSADWQETVKNGYVFDYGRYVTDLVRDDPGTFFWRMQNLRSIIDRWAVGLSPDHVHIITVPPKSAPPDELWRRFCSVIGFSADEFPGAEQPRNQSMGIAGTEFIRQLPEFVGSREPITPQFRQVQIKRYLAQTVLAEFEDEPIGLQPEHIEFFVAKSRDYVNYVREHRFHVVGDIDSLISDPLTQPPHVTPHAKDVADAGVFGIVALTNEIFEMKRDLVVIPKRIEQLEGRISFLLSLIHI